MSDLISREALEQFAMSCVGGKVSIQQIHEFPTVELRRGKWLDFHVTSEGVAEELCSRCEEWTIGRNKRYCPNCGANNRPLEGETNVKT